MTPSVAQRGWARSRWIALVGILVAAAAVVLGVTVLQDSDGTKTSPKAKVATRRHRLIQTCSSTATSRPATSRSGRACYQAKPRASQDRQQPRKQGRYAARLEAREGEFIGSDTATGPAGTERSSIASPRTTGTRSRRRATSAGTASASTCPRRRHSPRMAARMAMTILQWTTAAPPDTKGWEQLGHLPVPRHEGIRGPRTRSRRVPLHRQRQPLGRHRALLAQGRDRRHAQLVAQAPDPQEVVVEG